MSQPDLNDPRFETIVRELREKAPPAPESLRDRVDVTARSQATRPLRSRGLGLRRGLALAAAAVVTVGAGAALVNALTESGDPVQREVAGRFKPVSPQQRTTAQDALRAAGQGERLSALPPAGRRLQDYDAEIRLRVKGAADLDRATKQAMRDTRRLGGFVASTDFATRPEDEGDATLVLRVPIDKVQEAIARYSDLGTIISQQVTVDDLQTEADRLSRTIAQHRRRIAELRAKERRTPAEEVELQSRIAALQDLTRRRTGIVREAAYASVTLELTTQDAAEKREEPGSFRTFWDDASKILVTELIWLLYALVVAGPFVLLALFALLAERARRRRTDDALLAHH